MADDSARPLTRLGNELAEQALQYARLMRLDRPVGIWLLLWPTLWGLWIAGKGHPEPVNFLVFVAGVVVMRSAGCAVNDFADRDFDPHVKRTRNRPLAARRVSPIVRPRARRAAITAPNRPEPRAGPPGSRSPAHR